MGASVILKIVINKRMLISEQIWCAGHREEDQNHDAPRALGNGVNCKAYAYCPPSGTQEENTELSARGTWGEGNKK